MIIESTAKISIETINDLIAECRVFDLTIKDEENYPKGKTYDIFVLLSIKRRFQEFLKGCPDRNPNNPNSEKEIFSYIYTKLAHYATYDEVARDANQSNAAFRAYASDYLDGASGIDGVMIGRCGLCSGFAETLRNLLAEKGIKAKYVTGWKKNADGSPSTHGHAWNQVKLDGEWFNCDITVDRRFIVEGLVAPNFLKSNHDFVNYLRYPTNLSTTLEKATRSLTNNEQSALINNYHTRVVQELAEQDEKNKPKKKGFFKSISEKLKAKKISQRGDF